MTIQEVHSFTVAKRIDKVFLGHPIRHRAECSCGWVGEDRRDEEEAMGDGFAHKAMATSPPPDLPRAA